jgi:hypothetical protein
MLIEKTKCLFAVNCGEFKRLLVSGDISRFMYRHKHVKLSPTTIFDWAGDFFDSRLENRETSARDFKLDKVTVV